MNRTVYLSFAASFCFVMYVHIYKYIYVYICMYVCICTYIYQNKDLSKIERIRLIKDGHLPKETGKET